MPRQPSDLPDILPPRTGANCGKARFLAPACNLEHCPAHL